MKNLHKWIAQQRKLTDAQQIHLEHLAEDTFERITVVRRFVDFSDAVATAAEIEKEARNYARHIGNGAHRFAATVVDCKGRTLGSYIAKPIASDAR